MKDFLDKAEDLMYRGSSDINTACFKRVFQGWHALKRVQSNAALDLDNVESVFGAFEAARLFGTLGDLNPEEVERLPDDIAQLIVDTVECEIGFQADAGTVKAPRCYQDFVKRICCGKENETSVITFNYDVGLDRALREQHLSIDYVVDGKSNGRNSFNLLKLHGSVNWSKRSDDPKILQCLDVASIEAAPAELDEEDETTALRVSPHLVRLGGTDGKPFIVPPTWNKLGHYDQIAPVWKRAAEHLSQTENIYVIGFSLPPSDEFFRLLYALGTVGERRLRRFWVFNPDPHVVTRFRTLLGPLAGSRFEFFQVTFSEAVSKIATRWRTG